MCEDGVHFVVSNGSQTDNLITALRCGKEFDDGILGNQYEPDKPNYTQRITGICALDSVYTAELSILRKSASDDSCDRCFYQYEAIPPGFGRFISTYSGDGSPLPPFRSEPLIMPLIGHSIEFVAETYWAALNEANRVSLAVKFISKTTRKSEVKVINKFVRV